MGGGWSGGLTPCWAEKYSVYTWYSNEGVKGYYKEAVQIYLMDSLTGLFIWPSQLERLTKQMREAEQRLKAIPQFCFPDAKDWSLVSEYNRYHCFAMRCSEFRILAVTEKPIIFIMLWPILYIYTIVSKIKIKHTKTNKQKNYSVNELIKSNKLNQVHHHSIIMCSMI